MSLVITFEWADAVRAIVVAKWTAQLASASDRDCRSALVNGNVDPTNSAAAAPLWIPDWGTRDTA